MIRGTLSVTAAVIAAAIATCGSAEAQQYNWNGVYIGVEGGGGNGRSDWNFWGNIGNPDPLGNPNPSRNFVANPQPGGPEDPGLPGSLVGGHVGYMHQMDGLVLGIDGAWDWSNFKGTSVDNPNRTPPDKVEVDIKSVGTVNGRIGVANGRWLAYATGGFAFGSIDAQEDGGCSSGCVTFLNKGSFNRTGWDAGAGIAYALTDSLILGAEYDHIDLGTSDENLRDPNCANCKFYETVRTHPELDVIKASLSWKFGGDRIAPAPLK